MSALNHVPVGERKIIFKLGDITNARHKTT